MSNMYTQLYILGSDTSNSNSNGPGKIVVMSLLTFLFIYICFYMLLEEDTYPYPPLSDKEMLATIKRNRLAKLLAFFWSIISIALIFLVFLMLSGLADLIDYFFGTATGAK